MGWQTSLLEDASDLEITQQEVTSLMSDVVYGAIQAMMIMGIVTMVVKEFYDVLGSKKFAKQEKEVLGMVKKIW